MTAYDEPSLDGGYNTQARSSTWWSSYELYDNFNRLDWVFGHNYVSTYDNSKHRVVLCERRDDFEELNWSHYFKI